MKIYRINEYGKESYVSSFDKLTEEQKRKFNRNNPCHCVKEIELNEENICLILNKILHNIDNCNSYVNSHCF